MSSQEDNDTFLDTVASPSTSVSQATLPLDGTTDNRNTKKRKLPEIEQQSISQQNQAKFKVLKKLNIQLTRTNHHINYLKRCERTRIIPKALRVTLTPQVPVVSSFLRTKCAPSYAVIFMGQLEEKFLRTRRLLPLVWWRYIDDIFMIWPHPLEELYSFVQALNNVHESIKFTIDISQTQTNFLDVTVFKDTNGNIDTSISSGSTDCQDEDNINKTVTAVQVYNAFH